MNLTAVFIHRPVATVLLALALCAAGGVAYTLLPVSALPQVDFPTISVSVKMPGGSPQTMATSVATPLERALGTIAGITEMTSVSSSGSTRIIIQFDLDRDINGAARDVQAAINTAMANLPPNLPNNPTYRLVNPADSPIMMVALTSETMFPEQLYDLASTILAQKISQVDGVGQVDVGGGSLPAVRVAVNTDQLHNHGLSLQDVRDAISTYNVNMPQGAVEDGGRHWQISATDHADKAAEYAPLIISWRNNSPVRLRDVATVTDSVQDINNVGFANGKRAVMLVIYRKPGANIIAAVDAVKAALPRLRELIPPNVHMREVYDRTVTIRASLDEVMRTLYIAVCLVVLVVFIFLHNLRATFIPTVATGASLIGTFAGMYICGFSLDNLSLMALAVATGFVVDDAIVVLENITRHIEGGRTPFQAAITGAREVSFTVLSISLSLVAVFIPILLMGGIVGRLFREFAITLSMAIGVSLLLSLTLTPMLCAHLLRSGRAPGGPPPQPNRLEIFQDFLHEKYVKSLYWVLGHKAGVLFIWFCTVGLTMFLYIIIPKGFFPEQDTGMIRGSLRADQSISFQNLRGKLSMLMDIVRQDPAVATVAGYTGSSSSSAFVSITLKPRDQRDATADEVIARLRPKVMRDSGAQLFMSAAQDIRVGGRSSRAAYQYTLQGPDLGELRLWAGNLMAALRKNPIFKDLNSDLEDRGLESRVTVDRNEAARLGVTMRQVDSALGDAFSQAQVSTMYRSGNQYRVVMVTEDRLRQGPDGLHSVRVPGKDGLAPLSAVAEFSQGRRPVSINHQGQNPAVTISFNLDPGASLSDATAGLEAARRDIRMPASILASFQGTAKEFQKSLSSQPLLILSAVLCLYIVLGVLYESCIHPVTILSTLPPASIGALLALRLFNMDFSVIALIGILLLAGIVKKNAILLVDFAIEAERGQGKDPQESIATACALRFRPIMMTTMAAILGAVPLAIGFGDGSELRRPLGVAIIGGLLLSQILTLYTTPVLYLYLDSLSAWWRNKARPAIGGLFGRPAKA